MLSRLIPHLQPDEHVLWLGTPDVKRAWRRKLLAAAAQGFLIGFLCSGAAIAFVLWSSDEVTWLALCTVGLATMAGSTALTALIAALYLTVLSREVYAITDREFLRLSGDNIHRISPRQAYNVEVRHHRDGTGTVTFLGVPESMFDDTLGRLAFEAITEIDDVVSLARQVAQQTGYQEPSLTFVQVLARAVSTAIVIALSAAAGTVLVLGVCWLASRQVSFNAGKAIPFLPILHEWSVQKVALAMYAAVALLIWALKTHDAARRSGLRWIAAAIGVLQWLSTGSVVILILWMVWTVSG
jgi:hypothetical protein